MSAVPTLEVKLELELEVKHILSAGREVDCKFDKKAIKA